MYTNDEENSLKNLEIVKRLKESVFFPNVTKEKFSTEDFLSMWLLKRLRREYKKENENKCKRPKTKNIFQLLEWAIKPKKQESILIEAHSQITILHYLGVNISIGMRTPHGYPEKETEIIAGYLRECLSNCLRIQINCKRYKCTSFKKEISIRKNLWLAYKPNKHSSFEHFSLSLQFLTEIFISKEVEGKTKRKMKSLFKKTKENNPITKCIKPDKSGSLFLMFKTIKYLVKELSYSTILVTCFAPKEDLDKWSKMYEMATDFLYKIWLTFKDRNFFHESISEKRTAKLTKVPKSARYFLASVTNNGKGSDEGLKYFPENSTKVKEEKGREKARKPIGNDEETVIKTIMLKLLSISDEITNMTKICYEHNTITGKSLPRGKITKSVETVKAKLSDIVKISNKGFNSPEEKEEEEKEIKRFFSDEVEFGFITWDDESDW